MKQALKLAFQTLKLSKETMESARKKIDELKAENKALKEALAKEKALQALHSENERLGLYKDAYAQPETEPVAWLDGPHLVVRSDMRDRLNYKGPWVDLGGAIPDKWTPYLYTTPSQRKEPPDWFHAVENILNEYGLQAIDFVADFKAAMKDAEHSQRTWVGLTDEEFDDLRDNNFGVSPLISAVEAKLKEKNCD